MIPIKQTIFNNISGNCFGACLASLLEIPLEDVPNFGAPREKKYTAENLKEFLLPYGYFSVSVGIKSVQGVPEEAFTEHYFGYYIMIGQSYRGDWNHAVIYRGRNLIFDPMPEVGYRLGLKGPVLDTGKYEAIFLVSVEIKA